ncbi:hypothetical protein C5167_021131 [Papaver somniferum]|uniref:Uncharacterized protein n=1 Tax=Papaver somniferum TaxID=3469 RepID=A0A4Y7IV19_PAPSO|nr:hypothetical protein C5167_021131 [Papaver somniferum]
MVKKQIKQEKKERRKLKETMKKTPKVADGHEKYVAGSEENVGAGSSVNKEHIANELIDGTNNGVPDQSEENVGAEENSYKAKYRWTITLIEKLKTAGSNGISREYDTEDKFITQQYE